MDKILKAKPLPDFRLDILTSSGVAGIFDVKPYMGRGVFVELSDEAYFSKVRPLHHGIAWPNEQDLSSDTIIYDIQRAAAKSAHAE
jgi:Protein of unknown function (DUF2442)